MRLTVYRRGAEKHKTKSFYHKEHEGHEEIGLRRGKLRMVVMMGVSYASKVEIPRMMSRCVDFLKDSLYSEPRLKPEPSHTGNTKCCKG